MDSSSSYYIGANYMKLKLLGYSELLPTSAPSKQLCVSQRGVRRGGEGRGGEIRHPGGD